MKSVLKQTFVYQILKDCYLRLRGWIADKRRNPLIPQVNDFIRGMSSTDNNLTIISSNCFAGRIMQDLNMEYNSPTLGLYFMYPDYIEFLNNLKYYLTQAQIIFVESSKYPIGNERRAKWSHWYPIGLLDGKVEIHFLHYYSENEAAEKWYRRSKRVNFDNLLIIGMEQNLCSVKDITAFDKLTFKNKIMFTTKQLPYQSCEYLPEFRTEDAVGDPYVKGYIFYRHLLSHFNVIHNNKAKDLL